MNSRPRKHDPTPGLLRTPLKFNDEILVCRIASMRIPGMIRVPSISDDSACPKADLKLSEVRAGAFQHRGGLASMSIQFWYYM